MGKWQREPTAEEVEALVAERMACLPVWWAREVARLERERAILEERCRELSDPAAVAAGKALCREMREMRK